MRHLTVRELNRATLARQMLLERRALDVARAIPALGGLQAQWSPSPYIALWSRLDGFRRDDLTRALQRRRVVKAVLMRGTLHLVSARDFPALARVMRDDRAAYWRRFGERRGLFDARAFARTRERLLALAATPRTREELLTALRARSEDHARYILWGLRSHRDLVSAPPDGTWNYFGRVLLVAARSWLRDGQAPSADEARRLMLRRYLAAFGPAAKQDLASWSGLSPATFARALASIERELVRFEDDSGRMLYDLRRAPRPNPDTAAPVRFLPKWDSLLLAYAAPERVRVLPEAYRKRVIAVNGDVAPTVLVDGLAAARWAVRSERGAAVLTVEPFDRLSSAVRVSVLEEGERLVRFVEPGAGSHEVRIARPGAIPRWNQAIRP